LLSDAHGGNRGSGGSDCFVCFFAKQATASAPHPYLLDSSLVSPLAVLLFGGDLEVRRVAGRAGEPPKGKGSGKGREKRHAKDQHRKKNERCLVAVVGTGLAFEVRSRRFRASPLK
jgi:hypothetical protein